MTFGEAKIEKTAAFRLPSLANVSWTMSDENQRFQNSHPGFKG
jgi:hypothetical protein